MKLVYDQTGAEVKVGDSAVLRDGQRVIVLGIVKPHKPSSTGRVQVGIVDHAGEYFPSVINAHWIEREDQD
jgi:hypothetical protein